MTPDELRELAKVMRELGVFKLTLPSGICVEMSQAGIVAGQSERLAREVPAAPVDASPGATTKPGDDDDRLLYAATEGFE